MPFRSFALPRTWIYVAHCVVHFSFYENFAHEVATCFPPKTPLNGFYAPSKTTYFPGDVLRHSCDTDTEMIGTAKRMCTEKGEWTGETPYCSTPARLNSAPMFWSSRGLATANEVTDGDPLTCSGHTEPGTYGKEWIFSFEKLASVLAVRLILSGGVVHVHVADSYGISRSCEIGSQPVLRESHKWRMFYCPAKAKGMSLKITQSDKLSGNLILCEVIIFLEHDENETVCPFPFSNEQNGKWLMNGDSECPNVGSEAQLTCDPDYSLVGKPSTVICLSDAKWSTSNATCKKAESIGDLSKEAVDDQRVKTVAFGAGAVIIFFWIAVSVFCIYRQCKKAKDDEDHCLQLNDNPAFVTSLEDSMYK